MKSVSFFCRNMFNLFYIMFIFYVVLLYFSGFKSLEKNLLTLESDKLITICVFVFIIVLQTLPLSTIIYTVFNQYIISLWHSPSCCGIYIYAVIGYY